MPFNMPGANPGFANNYAQQNQLKNLQQNVPMAGLQQQIPQVQGPGNAPLLRASPMPSNPGMASTGPSPAMLNQMINQPLPNNLPPMGGPKLMPDPNQMRPQQGQPSMPPQQVSMFRPRMGY